MHALVLLCIKLSISARSLNFEVPSFNNSKDMTGAKLNKRVTWP